MRCLLDSSKRFVPKKQRDDFSSAALHIPLVIGAVRRASAELAQAATIELNAATAAAACPALAPPLAAAHAAAAAAVQALASIQSLFNSFLKIEHQPSSAAAEVVSNLAALSLSSSSPLALADRVVRLLLDLHAASVALAQAASAYVSSKEAELLAKAAGEAKSMMAVVAVVCVSVGCD
jgi:hypothetical protein